jgi:predicted ATPase
VFLKQVEICNFKSLRLVNVAPEGLATLIGPNGAGKTNFAQALRFLGEVHTFGLETAIARSGGLENIALRRARRSKSPISFAVEVAVDPQEIRPLLFPPTGVLREKLSECTIRHSFSCQATGGSIRAGFRVVNEVFSVSGESKEPRLFGKLGRGVLYQVKRDVDGKLAVEKGAALGGEAASRSGPARWFPDLSDELGADLTLGKQELLLAQRFLPDVFARMCADFLGRIAVFHFSSDGMRGPGTPTPNPVLSDLGENLPALVDWLQRRHKEQWDSIIAAMREIVPGLRSIGVKYLPTKTLGIVFEEEGFGRPWNADEVSDGTMHALSMLVAASDPRASVLVIEEPENSIHPWVLRQIGKHLRDLSQEKTVVVMTHSPVFIDLLNPSEAWIVSRDMGETHIRRLTDIDPSMNDKWKEGKTGLSEYLDAGLMPEAVPGGMPK